MLIIAIVLVFCSILLAGYGCAALVLRDERRIVVQLAFSFLNGTCLFGYVLICCRYLLDWQGAMVLSSSLLSGFGFLLLRLASRHDSTEPLSQDRLEIGLKASQAVLLCLVLVALALLSWLIWTNDAITNASRTSAETRFYHGGFAASMARGNFPPVNPMEPDHPLYYRWAYHGLAATISNIIGRDTPIAMGIVNVWLLVVLFAGVMALVLRREYSWSQGMMAATIALFGGTGSWLVQSQWGHTWAHEICSQAVPSLTCSRAIRPRYLASLC
jgi:hypothetical protein